MSKADFYAHSANDAQAWHSLKDHLTSVGQLSAQFAGNADWRDEARFAGEAHDLGKYGNRFQARLRGEDAGLDHWSQGAWMALNLRAAEGNAPSPAIAAALAIEGHHIGLQSANADMLRRLKPSQIATNHPLRLALSDPDLDRLLNRARGDGLRFAPPTKAMAALGGPAIAGMLDLRMLFSCLVDADFLDTEAHFNGDAQGKRPRGRGPALDPASAIQLLDSFMQRLSANKPTDVSVGRTP